MGTDVRENKIIQGVRGACESIRSQKVFWIHKIYNVCKVHLTQVDHDTRDDQGI